MSRAIRSNRVSMMGMGMRGVSDGGSRGYPLAPSWQ